MLLHPTSVFHGQTDLQVSQQFRQVTRILEATNSTLWQQLRQKTAQLGQKEVDLQESQTKLTLSQSTLQEKQKIHEATEQQLQACQSEGQRTKENLEREEQRRRDLNQRLIKVQDTLRSRLSCSSGIFWEVSGRWGRPPVRDGLNPGVSSDWVCLVLSSQ